LKRGNISTGTLSSGERENCVIREGAKTVEIPGGQDKGRNQKKEEKNRKENGILGGIRYKLTYYA